MQHAKWLILLLLLTACAPPGLDVQHLKMVYDHEGQLGALEEGRRWDRAEILILRERVKRLEEGK